MYINYINYVGCINKTCKNFKIKFVIKLGNGGIYLKGFLDLNLLNSLKNILKLIKYNYSNFNIFIFIEPYYYIKSDSSIDLSIFLGLISLINKIKIKKNICCTGNINEFGYILPVDLFYEKLITCYKKNINLIIFSKKNFFDKLFFKNYKFFYLKINHITDIYNLINKRLAQG